MCEAVNVKLIIRWEENGSTKQRVQTKYPRRKMSTQIKMQEQVNFTK